MSQAEAPPEPQSLSPLRWWICGLLFMATTLNYMDRITLNQMGKVILKSLSLDEQEYSYLESAFSVAFAFGAVTTGYIVDRGNVRFIYPIMVFGWSIAGFLTGFANSFWTLFGCRLMLGLFEAGNWPCGIRTTRTILPPAERSFGNSIFQSGTAVGAVVTPYLIVYLLLWTTGLREPTADTWQIPFRLIGLMGFVWIFLWFVTVPSRMLRTEVVAPGGIKQSQGTTNYWDIFADRRFWALLLMVIAINVTWHTYRAWLPLYLQNIRGYTFEDMTRLTTGFYITADIGSLSIGFVTLMLVRQGMRIHSARMLVYAACAGLALVGLAIPFMDGDAMMVALILVYAFAALGLFPTYFALTQEISAKHQGKVTGTLGAGAHLFLSLVMYPIEGFLIKQHGQYELVMSVSGVFPLLAFVMMLILWKSAPAPLAEPESPATSA